MLPFIQILAWIALIWSLAIVLATTIGLGFLFYSFSAPLPPAISSELSDDAPAVTIIRPVKGLEPHLYECIASTFLQVYPAAQVAIRLCIDSVDDPAYPLLKKIANDFSQRNVRVLVQTEDPLLHGPAAQPTALGPNPKIRNISRAYREAEGDLIWIIDCNVWVAPGVLGRMVDRLMGYKPGGGKSKPYKFVHQLPLVVDIVDYDNLTNGKEQALLSSASEAPPNTDLETESRSDIASQARANGGGRLDEMFMGTSHAKFYTAINAVGIAPCIVGKSNMFRKSHLDLATDPSSNPLLPKHITRRTGVDYFSFNICEDHLIGDILWRTIIPGHLNHGNTWGDMAIQPMAGMTIGAYTARRVRWLRARKFTVLAATLVEPGVESFLACTYFAFAATTLPWFKTNLGVPQTWTSLVTIWILSVLVWMCLDRIMFDKLHSGATIEPDEATPAFVKGHLHGRKPRGLIEWVLAWIGRETLALPIWTRAVLFGRSVNWRGKRFTVRLDTTVVEEATEAKSGLERSRQRSKHRLD